jgi:hypothetical protein
MKYPLGLIGLGTMVAFALLLPTQAKADTLAPLEDVEGQPSTLTSEAPLPEMALEGVPEIAAEVGEPEAVVPAIDATDSTQSPQPPEISVVEPTDTRASASPENSDRAQDEALLLLSASTNSNDLQPIEAPLASESRFQTPLTQSLDMAQTPSESSPSNQWHFLAVPYIYIPFSISGSATFQGEGFRNEFVGNFDDPTRDFDFSPSEIREALRNSLNFAFFSGFEAWTPNYNVGILANLDYLSLSSGSTVTRDVRIPGAAAFVPTEVNADLDTQLWRVDLAGSYRFYDPARANPEGIRSEYDLGPFVFDVSGGLSLISINTQLDLSTNLGGNGQFDSSRTIVSPLIGGRVRWNANPKLAVVGSGTISGFGISGLMQYGIQGGVDWMFSGNTSLGLGYRFGFLDYNSDQVDLNVDQNGPYINIGFRF